MKLYKYFTALSMVATFFVDAITATSVDGSDVVVAESLLTVKEEENVVLETPHRLTDANNDVLDQKTQKSNGNEVFNASSFNPQGQLKSTSS
jgi:hypothetical protein